MMAFVADNFGIVAQAQIKPCGFDFSMIKNLATLLRGDGEITIISFALPRIEFLAGIFDIRSKGVTILAHTKYASEARVLKMKYPQLRIFLDGNIHAKMVLAAPAQVWIGSANLGITRSCEGTVGIESRAVFGYFIDEIERRALLDPNKEVLT